MTNLDLPGVDPTGIDLVVDKNVTTVKAERSCPGQEVDELLVAERPQGSLTRRLFLADTVDADNIDARYDKGVLALTVAVGHEVTARRVEVKSGGSETSSTDAPSTAA